MVSRPGMSLNGNFIFTHLLLSFIVLISFYASGTCSSSNTGFNISFNSSTETLIWLVSNCLSTRSVYIWNPIFFYTLITFNTLWISVIVFESVVIYAVPNCMCLDIVIKFDLVHKHDVSGHIDVLVAVYKSSWDYLCI